MFSPNFSNPVLTAQSPYLPQTPKASDSPYRLPPIPKSASGNDLVSGIVEKFNSLSVMDRDEMREQHSRQIEKLKAALDRACMAREEAEEEAQRLRQKMLEMQEERVREREELRLRVSEWEKKYEKAKDRFKLQRLKNDEAMSRTRAEFMEKEKDHWRSVAIAQEAEEWERKQRLAADELIAFMELERKFAVESARASMVPPSPPAPVPTPPVLEDVPDEREQGHRDITPDVAPSLPLSNPYRTPAKQTSRVPVDFGSPSNKSDKENDAPPPEVLDVLKTPMTMDRAAALAAIEARRGRARSFMASGNGAVTPKPKVAGDRRDVSAPAVTMSVGRKK